MPSFVCDCYFGADRCSACSEEKEKAKAAALKRLEPSIFASLPDDVLERIACATGKTLPAFASVDRTVRQVVRPAMWRQAYEEATGEAITMGEACPPALWRACLLKDAM